MSSLSGERTVPRLRTPPMVRFVHWPLRDGGLGAWLMLTLFGGTGVLAGTVSDSSAMGMLCVAVLGLAGWRLWLPVTYELAPRGVTQTALGLRWRTSWSQVARYEDRRNGVALMTDPRPTVLSSFTSIFIPCRTRRDEVVRVIEFFLSVPPNLGNTTTQTYNA